MTDKPWMKAKGCDEHLKPTTSIYRDNRGEISLIDRVMMIVERINSIY